MDERSQRRVADNETIFRDVNEQLERGHDRFGLEGAQEFLCECGDAGCADRLSLTLAEYEQLRSHPRRFAVVPGHEIPGTEEVVAHHAGYAVVEKIGVGGTIADARDPRRDED